MAKHNDLGKEGEELAIAHLRKLGYEIRSTNYRMGKAELDIIAIDGNFVVFVEVKTRATDVHENPIEAVNNKKRKMMINAADENIIERNLPYESRFDIISVIKNGNNSSLEHVIDAFNGLTG